MAHAAAGNVMSEWNELVVAQDGEGERKEFDIQPATATIEPNGKQDVRLEFISTTVMEYLSYLAVDIIGVGESLLSIPIKANCVVPRVTLQEEDVSAPPMAV